MSTPAVESSSKGVAVTTTTVTVTKPSGVVDGDLLVAFVFSFDPSPVVASDETGWTSIVGNIQQDAAGKAFYKIASSEGANYTFDFTSTQDEAVAFIYRISNHNVSAPVAASGLGRITSTTSTPSVSISVSPPVSDALLLAGVISGSISNNDADISGYVISGTNPTWSEDQKNDTGGAGHLAAIISATANSISTITSLGWDTSGLGSYTGDEHIGILLAIPATTNQTINLDSLSIGGNMQEPALSANANSPTLGLLSIGASPQSPDTTQTTPKWVNKDKSATTVFTNKNKS